MSTMTDIAGEVDTGETSIQLPGSTITQLCLRRTNRYAIGFSLSGVGGGLVTTKPSASPVSGTQLPTTGIQWFTVKDQGPLAMAQWFEVGGVAGSIITVWEVFLPRE